MSWLEFLEFLVKKVTVQALVTVTLTAAATYAVLSGLSLPEWYTAALMLALGFYFGKVTGEAVAMMKQK